MREDRSARSHVDCRLIAKRIIRLGLAALTAATLSACAADGPASSVTRRDSAGITIVESVSPRWSGGAGWTVDPEPLLDLATSGDGEPHEFFGVTDALRLRDGSIAVALGRAGEIRFFSSTGEFLRTVGRRGDGPGEFRRLVGLEPFRGDSILAFDTQAQRVTIVSPEWNLGRIISFQPESPWVVRPLGASSLITVGRALDAETVVRGGHARRPQPVVRFSLSGVVIDTVTTTLGAEIVILEAGAVDARALFGRNSYLATRGEAFYLGSSETMEYAIFGAAGEIEWIIRVPDYDLRLSEAEVEAERAVRLGLDPTPRARRLTAALPVPELRPAYSDLLVDTEGFVWAAEHNGWFMNRIGSEPRDWEVFDPEGEWLGSVRLPARFIVFEIGPDTVLGMTRDDVDVERVQLLRLTR